jgi:hypothetical protein
MIKPTVGNIVLFTPLETDVNAFSATNQPLAAIIAHVWSDNMVNLAIFDGNGLAFNRISVPFIQDGDPAILAGGFYCQPWTYREIKADETADLKDSDSAGASSSASAESGIDLAGKVSD